MTRPFTGRSGRFPALATFLLLLLTCRRATRVRRHRSRARRRSAGSAVAHAGVLILRGQTVVADGDDRRPTAASRPSRSRPAATTSASSRRVCARRHRRSTSRRIRRSISTFKLSLAARSESVFVSAAQVDSALSRTSDSVTVDHARRSRRASDRTRSPTACGSCPGFGVVQSGGRGAVTSLFPRGGESDYTLVLVDGIPQNAFGGGFDAAHLAHRRHRAHRGRARTAERALRQRRDRRHRADHHEAGRPDARAGLRRGRRLRHVGQRRLGRGIVGRVAVGRRRSTASRPTATRDFATTSATRVTNDDYSRVNASGGVGWSDRPDATAFAWTCEAAANERGFPGPYGSDPLQTLRRPRHGRARHEHARRIRRVGALRIGQQPASSRERDASPT